MTTELAGRRRTVARLILAAAVVAGSALTAGPAHAEASQGIEIAPGRIEADVDGARALMRFTIRNHDAVDRQLDLDVTGLSHDLDGTPLFSGSAPGVAADADRFVLGAGKQRVVEVVADVPAGAGTYAGVVVSYPAGASGVTARVASLLLLRGTTPWTESVAVEGVELTPLGGLRHRVSAVVRNTGSVHVKPSGSVTLSHGGIDLATVPLPGETILPGAARRLSAEWMAPGGLPGDLTGRVDLRDPDTSLAVPVRTVAPGSGSGGDGGQGLEGGTGGPGVSTVPATSSDPAAGGEGSDEGDAGTEPADDQPTGTIRTEVAAPVGAATGDGPLRGFGLPATVAAGLVVAAAIGVGVQVGRGRGASER